MQFASEYERLHGGVGGRGIIVFPDDGVLRREVLPVRVPHPAKNNLYMYREICKYGAEEFGYGTFCDPMAGGGSMLYAGWPYAESMHLIELEEKYVRLMVENKRSFSYGIYNTPFIWQENCITQLHNLINDEGKGYMDMIVFSPPYSNQFSSQSGKGMHISEYDKDDAGYAGFQEFTEHKDNLSSKSEFHFNIEMDKVFKACYEALSPGGMMVLITKDRIDKGKIVDYSMQQARMCARAGFKVWLWEQHTHVGKAFGYFNLSKGYRQVVEEDVIFFRRGIDG